MHFGFIYCRYRYVPLLLSLHPTCPMIEISPKITLIFASGVTKLLNPVWKSPTTNCNGCPLRDDKEGGQPFTTWSNTRYGSKLNVSLELYFPLRRNNVDHTDCLYTGQLLTASRWIRSIPVSDCTGCMLMKGKETATVNAEESTAVLSYIDLFRT